MIAIKVIGEEKVLLRLSKIKKNAKNLKPALAESGEYLTEKFQENFNHKGRILQNSWSPRKYFYPWRILQKKGTLKNSWKQKAENTKLTITNEAKSKKGYYYGYAHHMGLKPQTGRRQLVGMTQIISNRIKKIISKFIIS